MGNPHDNKPTPHMQPAPEGVSEAEIVRHMTHEEWRGCRIESYRWKFKIPEALQGSEWDWSYASHWSTPAAHEEAEALVSVKDAERALLSALSSERERAERAELALEQFHEGNGWTANYVAQRLYDEKVAAEARAEAAEAKVKELLGLLAPFLPINAVDTRDYAELSFGDHQTQAMTMQPDDWIALSDAALRWTETQGEGE